jgi:hypothetical protein
MLPLVYDEELIMPYFQNVLYAAQHAKIKLLVFNTSDANNSRGTL